MWTNYVKGGPRRVNHAAVLIGENIYSFGGFVSNSKEIISSSPIDIFVLNTVTYRWQQIQPANPEVTKKNWCESLGRYIYTKKEIEYFNPNRPDNDADCRLLPDIPLQRYGHTVVEYGGKVYLWGGRNDLHDISRHLYEFDPATLLWKRLNTVSVSPSIRDGHTATVEGNRMYIFGGYDEGERALSNQVCYYDFGRKDWHDLNVTGDVPCARDFHTTVAIGKKLYVWGGWTQLWRLGKDTYHWEIDVLDLEKKIWEKRAAPQCTPAARRSHSAWVYNGLMYIYGGYLSLQNIHFGDLWCYNPSLHTWTKLRPRELVSPPGDRRRHCSVLVGDQVFLFGGTAPLSGTAPQADPEEQQKLTELADLCVFANNPPPLFTLAADRVIRDNLDTQVVPEDVRKRIKLMTTDNFKDHEYPSDDEEVSD